MNTTRTLAALLALSGLAALPACSMFGGGSSNTSRPSAATTSAPSSGYTASPNYNAGAPAGTMQSAELTPDTIRGVQQTLQQDGMYRGRVDGVWGPGTQAGVRSFQEQHNLDATGKLDQSTLSAMNIGSSQNSAPGSDSAPNYSPPPGANNNPPPDANNPNAPPPR